MKESALWVWSAVNRFENATAIHCISGLQQAGTDGEPRVDKLVAIWAGAL
jgi:hypothetical protein